jgi:hypothetical protein
MRETVVATAHPFSAASFSLKTGCLSIGCLEIRYCFDEIWFLHIGRTIDS